MVLSKITYYKPLTPEWCAEFQAEMRAAEEARAAHHDRPTSG